MHIRTSHFHAYALVLAAFPGLAAADGEAKFKTISTALTLALPAAAAGLSLAQDDASGLLQLTESEAVTLAATQALKLTVHETRPNGRDDKSFPSGHSAVSFAAAQYIQIKGGWELGAPAYLAASAVAYGRVRANEHYWKDVLAGAALGIASSYCITDARKGTKFSAFFGPNSAYAQITSRW